MHFMITNKLKYLFGLSILLFIAHGIEEISTGFYSVDAWDQFLFATYFSSLSASEAMFITFQIMIWLFFVGVFLLLLSERIRLYILALVGVIYLYELHHPIEAFVAGGYYPGLMTSLPFPVVAFFFWKEWIKNYKTIK